LVQSKYRKAVEFYELKGIADKFDSKLDNIFKTIKNYIFNSVKNLDDSINHVSGSIINSNVNPDFNKDDMTTFDIQKLHMDFKRFSFNILSDKNFPMSVLIALEDNTDFRVLLNSHKMLTNKEIKTYEIILRLMKGQVLIFHPNLVHSGWYFSMQNIRLHLYLDNYNLFKRKIKTDAWYNSDNIFETVASKAKLKSLKNLKSFNNNRKLKFNRLQNLKKL
jgi:hypothetical protein